MTSRSGRPLDHESRDVTLRNRTREAETNEAPGTKGVIAQDRSILEQSARLDCGSDNTHLRRRVAQTGPSVAGRAELTQIKGR